MYRDLTKILIVLGPYFIAVSTLAIFVTWVARGVNPYQFIGLDDVVNFALPALLITLLIIMVFWSLYMLVDENRENETLSSRSIKNITIVIVVLNMVLYLMALAGKLENYFGAGVYFVVFTFSLLMSKSIAEYPLFRNAFETRAASVMMSLLLVLTPACTLEWTTISDGYSFSEDTHSRVDMAGLAGLCDFCESQNPIYLGRLGEFLFVKYEEEPIAIPVSGFRYIKVYFEAD